jgi:hypothetical protein
MAAPNNKEVIQQHSPPQGRDLSQALVELQGLTFTVVAGAAADADIAITGFSYANDTILSVLHFNVTAGDIDTLTDKTSEVQAGSVDGAFQLSTTATTGDTLLVVWLNKGAL